MLVLVFIRGCFPLIQESGGRRDAAGVEGNQKAVVKQYTQTHTNTNTQSAALLFLEVWELGSQMN